MLSIFTHQASFNPLTHKKYDSLICPQIFSITRFWFSGPLMMSPFLPQRKRLFYKSLIRAFRVERDAENMLWIRSENSFNPRTSYEVRLYLSVIRETGWFPLIHVPRVGFDTLGQPIAISWISFNPRIRKEYDEVKKRLIYCRPSFNPRIPCGMWQLI